MKSYQTPDPLHGHGKAMPKPKQPNPHGNRLPSEFTPYRIRPGQIGRCCVTGCRTAQRRAQEVTK